MNVRKSKETKNGFGARGPIQVGVDPLVRALFKIIDERNLNHADLANKAGIGASSLSAWKKGTSPSVGNLRAVLNVIGLDITLKEKT